LLRELIGGGELRELLDPDVLAEVEGELQQTAEGRHARDPDELHDLLRRVGDLTDAELAVRAPGVEPPRGHAVKVKIAGEPRWIAVEDAARYRDGLGVALPAGIPQTFLEASVGALESLVHRYARTHAPFGSEHAAARWGLPVAV